METLNEPAPTRPRRAQIALLPLRFFLGGTAVYAAFDKLLDERFLDAGGPGSLARQLEAAAGASPVGGILEAVVPMAAVVGIAVIALQVLVGVCTLVGRLARPAAAGGALLSIALLLTIGWGVEPYYYGNDLPYLLGWITLFLGTPGRRRPTTPPASSPTSPSDRRDLLRLGLGGLVAVTVPGVAAWLTRRPPPPSVVTAGATASSTTTTSVPPTAPVTPPSVLPAPDESTTTTAPDVQAATAPTTTTPAERAGSAPTTSTPGPDSTGDPVLPTSTTAPSSPSTSSAPGTTTTTTTAPEANPVVARSDQVVAGDAFRFSHPSTGKKCYVTRTPGGGLFACRATCTHASCEVDYARSTHTYDCPCHGSSFGAEQGDVRQGPALDPLPPVGVYEDGSVIRLR